MLHCRLANAGGIFFVGFATGRLPTRRHMNADHRQLLRRFQQSRSGADFEALVRTQVDLVYSAARRICAGDRHLAEDVTQTVFADLARKAARLPADVILSGWLYRHTFFVASSMIRAERRRRTREQEAVAMNAIAENNEPDWSRLAPYLDAAMNQLGEADRLALVLRYFDKLDLQAIGQRLGISEDAAQKRVARALEKLKARFAKNGVQVSLATLAETLLAHAVTAAPLVLSAQIASAVASGAVAGTGLLVALEKMISMNALKPLAAALAVAGVATPLFLQHQSLAALRDQNSTLEIQVAELDRVRAENERLAGLAVDFRELEALRKEHLELMRLRGEATLLRNQLEELKREFERQRQLLLAKGASEEELLTEDERQARRQLMIEARFIELPLDSPLWAEFGLRPPATATDEGGFRALDSETAAELMVRLEKAMGVDLVFAPRVTTLNGRQTQIKSVEVQTIVTGKSGEVVQTEAKEFGPILDLNPTFVRGADTLQLKAVFTATQFLGYDDSSAFSAQLSDDAAIQETAVIPLPRFNYRQINAEVSLSPGQVLVLTGGYSPPELAKEPANQRPAKGLIVLITPAEITAIGEPVAQAGTFVPVASPAPPNR